MAQDRLRFTKTDLKTEARVDELLAQMTLGEKVGQMVQISVRDMAAGEGEERIRRGQAGSVLTVYGAAETNRLQKIAVEESRLRIPLIIGNDVIHGFRTIFPIPLAESCTWNPGLVQAAARIAAEEATSHGTHWNFAPMVDICRDPRWGRIAEGAGEDPLLGEQWPAPGCSASRQTIWPAAAEWSPVPSTMWAMAQPRQARTITRSTSRSECFGMCTCPLLGLPLRRAQALSCRPLTRLPGFSSANPFTLDTVLRKELGFGGVVLSDWNAIGELIPHGFAADLKEAAMLSVLAGVDMDMVADAYHNHLAELVTEGMVPLAVVDAAVRRVLRLKIALGLFEQPYVDESLAMRAVLQPAYRAKALEVAQKSMVLLKNDGGLLPLSPDLGHVALIGPLAGDHHEILGCWYRFGRDEDAESVLDGMRAVLPPSRRSAMYPAVTWRERRSPIWRRP